MYVRTCATMQRYNNSSFLSVRPFCILQCSHISSLLTASVQEAFLLTLLCCFIMCSVLFYSLQHLQPQWTSDGSGIVFVGWENSPRKLGIMYCSNRRLANNRQTDLLMQPRGCRRANAVVQNLHSDDISDDEDGSCEPLSNPQT